MIVDIIANWSPWILSILMAIGQIAIGYKWKYVNLYMAALQPLWWPWMYVTDNWGFVIINIMSIVIGLNNHRKWMKD